MIYQYINKVYCFEKELISTGKSRIFFYYQNKLRTDKRFIVETTESDIKAARLLLEKIKKTYPDTEIYTENEILGRGFQYVNIEKFYIVRNYKRSDQ